MTSIPKILYTFWTNGNTGVVVDLCIQSMKRHFDGYEFVMLTSNDLPKEMQTASLPPAQQADFARLDALARTGGVWLDASCFVFNRSWLEEEAPKAEVMGFGAPFDGEILESWALAAPAASPFMIAWRDEFKQAIKEGTAAYCNRVKDHVPPNLHGFLPYLTIHATAAVVRNSRPPEAVHLSPSVPHGPYGVHSLLGWNDSATALYILTQPADNIQRHCGSFCKLRGAERLALEQHMELLQFHIHPESIMYVKLQQPDSRGIYLCLACCVLVVCTVWWFNH